ncbi:MAG: phosphopentomutase [Proteobacteria bacterium]|nr:phosphopentomutase [Pseudomonadota bacterium]
MKRVFILLLDSLGIGASQDAQSFGDVGGDTFGHIVEYCATGKADVAGLRAGPLKIDNLCRVGLHFAALASTGVRFPSFDYTQLPQSVYGYAVERSFGKDTPSGHWEMMGVPALFHWGYFPPEYPSFPEQLIQALISQGKIPGVLGNKHASGTEIIRELGEEHIRTGKPIVYTSADSVFQIAAHEQYFGLQRLYDLCEVTRKLVNTYNIGRVIARPFIGEPGHFTRTANRHDYTTPPPSDTLLDQMKAAGKSVIAIGKISDIFAHRGVTETITAQDNMSLFDATLKAAQQCDQGGIVFTNFVDFDSSYGHRRDVAGYANALEMFDRRLPELEACLKPGDIVFIVADHGCDPTFKGSDHTREHIPVLMFGPGVSSKFIGRRESFADVGQTIAQYLGMRALPYGVSFL